MRSCSRSTPPQSPSSPLSSPAAMSVPPSGHRQVSLRGSSAREITRDVLLQKVSEERQLRSHLRRAAAAALTIQIVIESMQAMHGYRIQERSTAHEHWVTHVNSTALNRMPLEHSLY